MSAGQCASHQDDRDGSATMMNQIQPVHADRLSVPTVTIGKAHTVLARIGLPVVHAPDVAPVFVLFDSPVEGAPEVTNRAASVKAVRAAQMHTAGKVGRVWWTTHNCVAF
jgi:hypothetical protein